MKQLAKKWNDLSLIIRILIGLVLGAVLGVVVPQFTAISVLGKNYLKYFHYNNNPNINLNYLHK